MKLVKFLFVFFFTNFFLDIDAQLFNDQFINLQYDEANNCVTASFDECSASITGSIETSQTCNCLKNVENTDCYKECLQYFCGYDLDIECELCKDACRLNQCNTTITPQPQGCKPCLIRYRLVADYAPIPFDPKFHAGNRLESPIFESGGNGNGECVNFTSQCNNICDPSCGVNQPIEFDCFELPPNWNQIISGSNVCYGIEILSIQFAPCSDYSCIPFQGTRWTCIIIG